MWFRGISTVQIVGGRFAESLASDRLGAYSTYICVVNFCFALLVLGLVGPLGISASLSSHNHPTRNNGFLCALCVPLCFEVPLDQAQWTGLPGST